MTPATADYKAHVRGDTISDREFTITKTIDEITSPLDLTGAIVKASFALNNDIIAQSVTITDASLGKFKIDSFTLNKVGVWAYDVQIVLANGSVKTWVKGSITIEGDVTK